MFTDGEGVINENVGFRLRNSEKMLYLVYILDEKYNAVNESLKKYVKDSITIYRNN